MVFYSVCIDFIIKCFKIKMTSQKSMRKEKIIMKKLKKLNYATDGCTLETFGCYCSCSCWWFGTVNSSNDNANSNAGN